MLNNKIGLAQSRGWIVAVGASAGGLEALTAFVTGFSEHFQGSIIIAQHLAPHAKSMMVELISKHSHLPVEAAKNNTELAPAKIYVVPPNHDVRVEDSRIILTVAGPETRPKPCVDDLFFSLATNHPTTSVAVVLSGTGTDGAKGVEALHKAGGLVIAQSGDSAKYSGMPQAAIETSCVDSILEPQLMASHIVDHIAHNMSEGNEHVDEAALQEVLNILKEHTGSDFKKYRSSTIFRRLKKRMALLRIHQVSEYLPLLKQDSLEASALAQDFLISVTSFFRDSEAFESLRAELTEVIYSKKTSMDFRAWVAGCATGEEAYSLAILLLEIQEQLEKPLNTKIFATDLDYEALVIARNGVYKASDLGNLPQSYLDKYFIQRDAERFEVSKKLRDLVLFARQDMNQNPPFVKLDVVTCRNVLIYFEPDLQKRLLEIFHYALLPSALLFLGKSESLGASSGLFDTIDKKMKVFKKINVPSSLFATRVSTPTSLKEYIPKTKRNETSLLEKSLLRLMTDYGHCAVLVDKDTHIIQIIGDVSSFVKFASTQSDFRLLNLLPREVALELPILIRKSSQASTVNRSQWYRNANNDGHYRMTARSLTPDPDATEYFLINFEEKETSEAKSNEPVVVQESSARVTELEQELYSTREHLQTVIEELGVANEELQALNEELSSTNEELQSTNEELETTNEELQSSNEELTTVNEELSGKSNELRDLNVSLENVQESIGAGLIVIDRNRRIIRYNQESLKIFKLSRASTGSDITTLSAQYELPDFKQRLDEAITKSKTSEVLCEGAEEVYLLRTMPFLDENGRTLGAILLFVNYTNYIRTSERLKASEMQIRSIIEGFSNPITIKDQFGRYIMVNEAFLQFFSLTREAAIGKTDRELFDDQLAVALRDADLEVMLTSKNIQNEEVYPLKGRNHIFLVNRFPLFDSNPTKPYAVGMIATDISVQKRTQDQLEESESRYRALIEDQAVMVCRQLPNGKLIFVNTVFAAQFGGDVEKHLGHSFLEYLNVQDQTKARADIASLSPRHPVVQNEFRIYRDDSHLRWIRWFHRGIFDKNESLVEIQSVGFDVTDYRLRTDKLIENEAIFSTIFANTSDVITILKQQSNDFLIESLNNAGEALLEKRKGDLVGKTIREARKVDRANELINRFSQVLRENLIYSYEDVWKLDNGDHHFSNTVVPIPDESGQLSRLAVLSKDVSSYKDIELALRSAKDSAEVANVAKSNFLASMSHELRTPLNVVLGMSHLLQETSLTEEQKSYLSSIDRSGKALLSLIEDILDITKIESGKISLTYQTFNLVNLVRETVSMFEIQCEEKHVKLTVDISKDADRIVIGDAGRLRQVLVNLLGNALKFTDKGTINLRVSAPARELNGEKAFRFEVQDSGIGIKKSDHAKIFQRFSQVESGHSRRFGGSGLGLVISRQIAHMMKGDMGFVSEEGKGSTFWFEAVLQLSTHSEVSLDAERKYFIEHIKDADLENLSVLAVDDNRENLNIIKLFLNRLKLKPTVVNSGPEAIETFKNGKFDVILMDVQMPEMDGYEATRRIRAFEGDNRSAIIIALTANAMAGDEQRCKEAGMDDYISKPVRIEVLKKVISRWVAIAKKETT